MRIFFVKILFFLILLYPSLIFCQYELALKGGLSFNDNMILNNPDNIFGHLNDTKFQSNLNLSIAKLSDNFFHKLQIGVLNNSISYYLEDQTYGYGHSNSYSFWKIGYDFGRSWKLDNKMRFILNSSIGLHYLFKQKLTNFDVVGSYIEYNFNSDILRVQKSNVPEFKNEFCLVNENSVKMKVYKDNYFGIGFNFLLWRNSVFDNSIYQVSLNNIAIGELEIRALKPRIIGFMMFSTLICQN